MNGNYHGNMAQQPIKFKVSIKVTTDGKVTICDKFYATGPRPNNLVKLVCFSYIVVHVNWEISIAKFLIYPYISLYSRQNIIIKIIFLSF